MDKIVKQGNKIEIVVETNDADSILYFIINSKGKIQSTEELKINEDKVVINITSEESKKLKVGANSIKIFAISNSVLKPDFYESSFLVSEINLEEPKNSRIHQILKMKLITNMDNWNHSSCSNHINYSISQNSE